MVTKRACAPPSRQLDDRTRTLVIGLRQGEFPGMLKTRTFRVVLVTPGTGAGIGSPDTAAEVRYDGNSVTVHPFAPAQPVK